LISLSSSPTLTPFSTALIITKLRRGGGGVGKGEEGGKGGDEGRGASPTVSFVFTLNVYVYTYVSSYCLTLLHTSPQPPHITYFRTITSQEQ
jgi:hypothetical protein